MQFVTPQPFQEAIDKLGRKTVTAAGLDSEQWSRTPVAIRERSFFVSRLENARVLQRGRDALGDFLAGNREAIPDPRTGGQNMISALKTGSRAQFVRDMQAFMAGEGMQRTTGGLTDFTSEKRLGLIFDVNVRQAQDYGNWQQGQDPDVLDAFPAQRFIRVIDVKEPRDAHTPHENTVMLKTDVGFWSALNEDFGVPWGPWGWGCGHDVEDVSRDEAEALGLIAPGERLQPASKDLNDGLEAGTARLDSDLVDELKRAFAGREEVEFSGDAVKWKQRAQALPAPPQPQPQPQPAPPAPQKLALPKPAPSGLLTPQQAVVNPGQPIPQPPSATLADALKNAGITEHGTVAGGDMINLMKELKEDQPLSASQVVAQFKGTAKTGLFTKAALQADLQAFVDFFPAAKLSALPKLTIAARKLSPSKGGFHQMGGQVVLNKATIATDGERRRVLFHELMHWVHREGDPQFRKVMKDHFDQRTAGETEKQLPGYGKDVRGKTDKWYEAYAGRVYPWEKTVEGIEVPTRYFEWMTMTPKNQAELWNEPKFRETMKLVLGSLF